MIRILTFLEGIFVLVAWLDYVDVTVRIASGLAAVTVAYFAARAYVSKKKLTDIEAKIKQDELNERIKRNGHSK